MKKILKYILFTILIIILLVIAHFRLRPPKTVYAANSSNSASDLQLLARAVNGEARGESYEGQVAVAAVILNRVNSSKFPNTIAGVIYQPGAFTAVSDGQINVPIDEKSTVVKAAKDALNGWDLLEGLCTILIQIPLPVSGFGQDLK